MFYLAKKAVPFILSSVSIRTTARLSSKVHSLYNVFELPRDATHQEIKEAFYRLSKIYHPDVTGDPCAREKFHELIRAYEVLGNPVKRNEYDRGLIQPRRDVVNHFYEGGHTIDALKDQSVDSFKASYVKKYNRNLKEEWEKRADPELTMTAIEMRDEHRRAISFIALVFIAIVVFGHLYSVLTEEPIEFSEPVED
ncbi:unnamed protein product [Heterobilharzia americana]|nr:unnamed protein product [Heterobilharzia americana]